ncbi:methyltransferase domain-containing protein [Gammaproteobacteria bacterium]|nr:methyltransferase domain-containing protein [Gammaproteobacteria bacterium]
MKNTINFDEIIKFKQEECPCCHSKTDIAFDLPKYPITELYRPVQDSSEKVGFIDQAARFCSNCGHFFLENVLDPEVIYSEDNYITSSVGSQGALDCIDELYKFMQQTSPDFDFKNSNIVDIGGNDSTLLKYFDDSKKLVNIDPHASTDMPQIELHNIFFEDSDFEEFRYEDKSVYVSSHTFEHLEDPAVVLRKLAKIVKQDDLLFLQFPSIEKLVEHSRFDQICHQHINLFSLNSVSELLKTEGLFLEDFEYDNFHFGTIRLKFTRNQAKYIETEIMPLSSIQKAYKEFQNFYANLNSTIEHHFIGGQGFGAGLMVPTLAYHLPVIDSLDYIIDENLSRIDKKFINLSPSIVDTSYYNFDKPILITSISTKAAARAIFTKLDKLGFKDICLPVIAT